MDYIETEMITSIATIVLVILCIAVFIAYGGGAIFYAVVAITLIVGFANAWLIAKSGKALKQTKQTAKAAAPRRRRRRR